jgi:hypothetical protein
MSRLSKLFRPAARPARKARLGVESFDDRLVPSVTFTENTSAHTVEVVASANQNNTITIRNDGNGNLRIVADGVTRNFSNVVGLNVETGNGKDTVTYNQGTSTTAADLRRSFGLTVDFQGGWSEDNKGDTFTANVFGNVGYYDGTMHPRDLSMSVYGGEGGDRIDFNFHDTDVRTGSGLYVYAFAFGGSDNITLDSDGEVDGEYKFSLQGWDGNDIVAANILLDTGSNGTLSGNVQGDNDTDTVTLAVRHQTGSNADVDAVVDGGLSLGDHDVGRHTSNVRTAWLEQDIPIV